MPVNSAYTFTFSFIPDFACYFEAVKMGIVKAEPAIGESAIATCLPGRMLPDWTAAEAFCGVG
jgi:hypothetical protein